MQEAYSTVVIEDVYPEIECGRYPVKREAGDELLVRADIFKEGHDKLAAAVLYRKKGKRKWSEEPMRFVDNDRWGGSFALEENARYEYAVEAWSDTFASWLDGARKKAADAQNIELELTEGRGLIQAASERSGDAKLAAVVEEYDREVYEERLELLLSDAVAALMAGHPDRSQATRTRTFEVVADRERARYGAWYEMFHRSQGEVEDRSATFAEMEKRLPDIADMGFDVVYLVPIHPIGRTNRKGKDNALKAAKGDPGSPYAIGSKEGGHKAVNPELGTIEDFRRFVRSVEDHGMEVALDFAIQCSPDHPYLKEHPEWFRHRPDGSIKYAENPPKKYQDIVNVDFHSEDWKGLWREWLDVTLFWVEQGVKIFRVDNPHTKPFAFWEWLIRSVQDEHPEVIFLSEAFTRPKVMKNLAKLGFTQSYTYFTWRHGKRELTEYLTELTADWPAEYMRPNFFANTHDILPPILQFAGRPAFQQRLVLAATLSSTYGIYNGYELCENTPRGERGSTLYYADSEVYEYKVRDWDAPGNIKNFVRRINEIRRGNPALQYLKNLTFQTAWNDDVLFYAKELDGNAVAVAVNLDPYEAQEVDLELPLQMWGIADDEDYVVEELISGTEIGNRGRIKHVYLDPAQNIAEILRLRKL
ncbi:alpha-1,4-glucan--maltose-1-phosphate maltosyltransferase [soil metagenome]